MDAKMYLDGILNESYSDNWVSIKTDPMAEYKRLNQDSLIGFKTDLANSLECGYRNVIHSFEKNNDIAELIINVLIYKPDESEKDIIDNLIRGYFGEGGLNWGSYKMDIYPTNNRIHIIIRREDETSSL